MDVTSIVIRRSGMSPEDADVYIQMAEARVRQYLRMLSDADVSDYAYSVADIAVLYWQLDRATQQSSGALGYKSMSQSEGGVSRSVTAMTGAETLTTYEDAIRAVLADLDGTRGRVVFL